VWPWAKGGLPRWWAVVFAVAFLVAGLFAPRVLAPLNKLWFRFWLLLNRVINPIVMAIVFVGAIVPTGLLLRAFGKDLLRLKRQPGSDSYWIVREPPRSAAGLDVETVLGEAGVVPYRIVGVHACPQEILARPDNAGHACIRRARNAVSGIGRRTVHLHIVLRVAL
jgi:hypothetical protein